MPVKPYDIASTVTAEMGEVQIDGPDGVAFDLTPAAALETAERLEAAAVEALGQLRMMDGDGSAGPAAPEDDRDQSGR